MRAVEITGTQEYHDKNVLYKCSELFRPTLCALTLMLLLPEPNHRLGVTLLEFKHSPFMLGPPKNIVCFASMGLVLQDIAVNQQAP